MAHLQLLSQDWHRVADLRPRLRTQLRVFVHDYLDELWYVLHDRTGGKTYRLSEADFRIFSKFDGEHSIEDVWNALAWSNAPNLPTQNELIETLSQMYQSGLISVDTPPRSAQIARLQKKKTWQKALLVLKSPVSQKIPLINPKNFLRLASVTCLAQVLFSRLGGLAFLALMATGVYFAIGNWQPFSRNLADRALAPDNLLILALVYPVVKLIHELAHALAIRRFGGDVFEAGVMFLVFVPMPYVNASEANRLRAHKSRALITAAGILAELALAAIAMILWTYSDPGLWRAVLFNVVFICTVSTLFFNGNPLLRFDAYYILSDLTQTPNLGTRGNKLLGRWLRLALGSQLAPDSETAGPSARMWLAAYGVAAACYKVFITLTIALLVIEIVPFMGQFMAMWVVYAGLVHPSAKSVAAFFKGTSGTFMPFKFFLRAGSFALVAGLLFAVVPLPSRTVVDGVVIHADSATVFAPVAGFIEEIHVSMGTPVEEGAPLFTLRPETLLTEREVLDAKIEGANIRLRGAQSSGNAGFAAAVQREIEALEAVRADLDRRVGEAEVRATASGRWSAEAAVFHAGAFVPLRAMLGVIDAPENRRIVGFVPERRARHLRRGVTGYALLFLDGTQALADAAQGHILENAARSLHAPQLADRFGGPVMTQDSEDMEGFHTVQSGFALEIEGPLPPAAIGSRVRIKLHHPPETVFDRLWPVVYTALMARFGPGQ
jgi:putative peptide zinc metalloprotease protein